MLEAIETLSSVDVEYVQTFYTAAALDGHTRPELERTIVAESKAYTQRTIMCMGHNKGWEEAASSFAGEPIELQTCNAALLEGVRHGRRRSRTASSCMPS